MSLPGEWKNGWTVSRLMAGELNLAGSGFCLRAKDYCVKIDKVGERSILER